MPPKFELFNTGIRFTKLERIPITRAELYSERDGKPHFDTLTGYELRAIIGVNFKSDSKGLRTRIEQAQEICIRQIYKDVNEMLDTIHLALLNYDFKAAIKALLALKSLTRGYDART